MNLNFNILNNENNKIISENKHIFSNTKKKEIDAIDDMIDNYHSISQKQRDKEQMDKIVQYYKDSGYIPTDNELNVRFETLASVKDEHKKINYLKENRERMKRFEKMGVELKKKEEEMNKNDKFDKK